SGTVAINFVNGTQQGSDGTGHNATIVDRDGLFGIGSAGGNNFDGFMDDVRIYDTALTTTTIRQIMRKEANDGDANIVSYWRFNNDATDEINKPTGNNLTENNSPAYNLNAAFSTRFIR
ncbi:hypothetical protein LCGC14_1557400, partial [marine sediment metagenome]